MSQVTVISGAERRRSWSTEEKRALVAAACEPGANISEIARRADVRTGQIYRWRRDLEREASPGFAALTVTPDWSARHPETAPCGSALVIEVGGAVVRVAGDASPTLVTAVLRSLR